MASLLAAALASRMGARQNVVGVEGPEKPAALEQGQVKPPEGKPSQALEQPKRKKEKQQLLRADGQQHQTTSQQHHCKPTQQQQQPHQRIQQQQQDQQQQPEAHSIIFDSFAGCQQQLNAGLAGLVSLQSGGSRKKRKRKEASASAPSNQVKQNCRRPQKEEVVVMEQLGPQQAKQQLEFDSQQLQLLQQQQTKPQKSPIHQRTPPLRQPVEARPPSLPFQHRKQQEPLQKQPQPSQQLHKQLQQPVARQQQQQQKQQEQQPQKQQQQQPQKQHYLQQVSSEQHQASQLWQRERALSILEGAESPRVGSAGTHVHQQPQPPLVSRSLFTAHQMKSLQDGLRALQQEATAAPTLAAAAAVRGKAAALLLGAAARRLAAVAPRLSACLSRRMAELAQHHGIDAVKKASGRKRHSRIAMIQAVQTLIQESLHCLEEVDPKVLHGLCGGCGVPLVPFIISRLRTRPLARRFGGRNVMRRIKQQLLQRKAETAKGCLASTVVEETVCKLCGHRVEMAAGPLKVVGGEQEHQKKQEQAASRGAAFGKQKLCYLQQRRDRWAALQQQQRASTAHGNEKQSSIIPTVFQHRRTDALSAATRNCERLPQWGFAFVEENTGHFLIKGTSSTTPVASVSSLPEQAASSHIEKQAEITRVAQEAQICGLSREHTVENIKRDKGSAVHETNKMKDKKVNSVYAILAELDC